MDLQQLFDHWNLNEHPFQAEEARNDAVYKRKMEGAITHPDFLKIYGDPANPSTTIVFGEKGSGKTAMRLMIQQRLNEYNEGRESGKAWLVCYDDLNPVLDRLARNLKSDSDEKTLDAIRLSDHQDAMLSLAVTELIDGLLASDDKAKVKRQTKAMKKMSRQRRVDLGVLALLYDQPRHGSSPERWSRLLRLLRIGSAWDRGAHGFVALVALAAGLVGGLGWYFFEAPDWKWIAAALAGGVCGALLGYSWLKRAWRNGRTGKQLEREVRVVSWDAGNLSHQLWDLDNDSVSLASSPKKADQDCRYDFAQRFLGVISELGFSSLVVLVDRVDEPVLVNGDAKRIKKLVWPMLNNKFLQQENIGVKMLLPIEMSQKLMSEEAEFKRQARLDKQNLVNPLKWTGTSLYDLCDWRFRNCQKSGLESAKPLEAMFDEDVDSGDLIEALDQMHQPRDAFKLLYAALLEHCRNTPGNSQDYRITKSTLDTVRREQSQRVVDLYRGMS